MRLIDIHKKSTLKETIFEGEIANATCETVYDITYLNDRGEPDEHRVNSILMMMYFIKWIYEQEEWKDVPEDPRSDKWFQDYMQGDLVDQR